MLVSMSGTDTRAERKPPCILVVDDNVQNRLLVDARLTQAGYSVKQAENGEQALAMFAAVPCELVLLDVSMPGLDGFQTLERLRRLPHGDEVAVVFLTTLDDVDTHEKALRAGVDDYLTKPLRPAELLIRVRSLMRLSQVMSSLRASHELVSAQRDALIRSRDLRQQLSSFVVHDLKSPLAMIMAATDLVQRNASPNVYQKLQIVQRAAQNMLRMVHNLLDISRSEDGRMAVTRSELDVRALVEELVQNMRGARGEWHASIAFEIHYDLGDPKIMADAQLLRRVLENLLDNALRYSPTESRIRIDVRRSARELELVVTDEGPGIAPEQRERVFEMYVRLDEASPSRVGHGLGLVFCRVTLEAQGGRIWVEGGEDGHGAAFHAVLPLA